MRDAGLTKEQAATRLGHADEGQLLNRLYDRGDRVRRAREALDELTDLRKVLDPAGAGRENRASRHEPAPRPSRAERHLRLVG